MMNRADIVMDIEFLQEEMRRCPPERAWNERRIAELQAQLDELRAQEEEWEAGH